MAKKKYNPMEGAKESMGVGLGSMAGLGAMGALSGMPGMPKEAGGITSIAGAGLAMANVGVLSKNAMGMTSMFGSDSSSTSKKKKSGKSSGNSSHDKVLKMLGK